MKKKNKKKDDNITHRITLSELLMQLYVWISCGK